MGLERFLVLIHPAMASRSYEYPSLGNEPLCQRSTGGREARQQWANPTCGDDGLPHQLPGDWTQELAGDPGGG